MTAVENEQVCASCVEAIIHGSGRLANVPKLIKRIIREEMWRERKIRTGEIVKLSSLRELILRKPLEGWGEDPEKIEAVIRDDPEALALFREHMTPPPHRPISNDNIITSRTVQGTSRDYTLMRLRKENPTLFEKVKAGQMSANAAAIEAGWRSRPTTLNQLKKFWLKASYTDRNDFLQWIKSI